MKTTVVLWGIMLIAATLAIADERREIIPGVTLYDSVSDLRGQLVFLVGRFPESSDKNLPPAKVLSYDFGTKTASKLWDVPRAGELIVSQDGKWVGLILQDPAMMSSAEMLVFSVQNRDTWNLQFRSVEVHGVIVDDHIIVQTGSAGKRRLEVHALPSNETSQLRLPANPSATLEDYTFVTERISEPRRVFFGYEPGGPRSGVGYAGGTYAYDVGTRKCERVEEGVHERSAIGEIIAWEPADRGWALVARKSSGSVPNERVLCRYHDEEFNFKQVSPCLRYALMERTTLTSRGLDRTYFLCDLRSGEKRRFLEAKASAKTSGALISQVHWVGHTP